MLKEAFSGTFLATAAAFITLLTGLGTVSFLEGARAKEFSKTVADVKEEVHRAEGRLREDMRELRKEGHRGEGRLRDDIRSMEGRLTQLVHELRAGPGRVSQGPATSGGSSGGDNH